MLSGCFHFQNKKNMRLKNYSLFGSALLFSMFSVADVCEFEVPATENYSEAVAKDEELGKSFVSWKSFCKEWPHCALS